MKFSKFLDTYKTGKSYPAPDGSYLGECVSLVKCYIKDVLGVEPQSIGNAKEYWKKRRGKYLKSIFKPLKKGAKLQRGDVFVRDNGSGDTYGHIGIVEKVTKKGFTSIEQNHGGCRVVEHRDYPLDVNYHFLRPLNQTNITNKPNVKAGDKITLTNANAIYKTASKKEPYTVGEVTLLKCDAKAQFKKCTTLKVNAVDTVKGNVWVKTDFGYIIVYDKNKNKSYIK